MSETTDAERAAAILLAIPNRVHETYHRWLAGYADKAVLTDDWGSLTFDELDKAVAAIAENLRFFGIRPGDRLVIVSENRSSPSSSYFKAQRLEHRT